MDLILFQLAAERTMCLDTADMERLNNAALGLCGEAVEMIEAFWHGPPVEEAGDLL